MDIPCTIYLDIVDGDTPGTLALVSRVVADDGVAVDHEAPVPLSAGMTLSYGPVLVTCQTVATWSNGPTPPPATKPAPAPAKPGQAPAAKPGRPVAPGGR
jgi:hypothetical protein